MANPIDAGKDSSMEYDVDAKVLVLSADAVSGFVASTMRMNHVAYTKIYGDGKVVFIDPSIGNGQIYEGRVAADEIRRFFRMLNEKGFWDYSDSYVVHGSADLATDVITAKLRSQPEKTVGCYGGALSAPPGFMDCFAALRYPQLKPTAVKTYVREPIKQAELDAGWYFGFEYQKKLNTPRDWVWSEAGRSSKWHRPQPVKPDIVLDSGYMIPPIDGCRHIRISYAESPTTAGSTIQFDRNTLSPDSMGDIDGTTRMFFAPQTASFTSLHAETNKHLYSIALANFSALKLRLVIFGSLNNPTSGRLLVVDDHDAILNIYHLERR